MRNTFLNSKKFGSSNINASTAYRNYTSQPLNSLVVNQERNQKHQLQQSLQLQSTNSSPKSFNANRSCEKCKNNHRLAVYHEYQLCSFVLLVRETALLAKTVCVPIVLAIKTTNRHVRQPIDAKYAVVFIIQHCMTQENKSNFQQQLFQQKMHKKISLLFHQTTRQWLKIRSSILRQTACRIRIQTAASGKTSTVKTKPTLKDET